MEQSVATANSPNTRNSSALATQPPRYTNFTNHKKAAEFNYCKRFIRTRLVPHFQPLAGSASFPRVTTRFRQRNVVMACLQAVVFFSLIVSAAATPANKAALEKHYDKFLVKHLARCTTCHLPSDNKNPESLEEFPHNPFGARLRAAARELVSDGKKRDIPSRLQFVAREDTDADGADNETELLLGYNPGDTNSVPPAKELADAQKKRAEFAKYLASYRWQPFETVKRPPVPSIAGSRIKSAATAKGGHTDLLVTDSPITFPIRNPIDSFIAAEHKARGLTPRPAATKEILLRRVYLDLIGLSPTPEELAAFEKDRSRNAYEKVVDRLLDDPRYGERWARHWMDVWRYSDWAGWAGGNQIRDSKPHIWRWRDWIVESLNADKPYSRMIQEMLAADEIAPLDTNMLRATGFLVRNYKMLSREQWLEDTVKHTSQAFLGVTMGCAKCHDHMTDPISQAEYYQVRAIFEPHWVRTDKLPGNTNVMELGLARTFDTDTNPPTYFFNRGDERKPDTNRILFPDVPRALGGSLKIQPVSLPWLAAHPDKQSFVYRDAMKAADKVLADSRAKLSAAKTNNSKSKLEEQELATALVEAQRNALAAVIEAEQLEAAGEKGSPAWKLAATNAVTRQREMAMADARLKLHQARNAEAEAKKKSDEAAEKLAAATTVKQAASTNEVEKVPAKKDDAQKAKKDAAEKAEKAHTEAKKKFTEAEKALADAEAKVKSAADLAYKKRSTDDYPTNSTGRRLAFANWITDPDNPLTARVAVNQIWLRHFGRGIVETPHDFGRSGRAPSHPQLLDWLAAEFMKPTFAAGKRGGDEWSMKHLHRLIVTSSTYRLASTPDDANAKLDPDNTFLWRMNSRRMEAEAVRDNLLYVAGDLDRTMGGPDIDHSLGLKSKRRSLYLRIAAEKEVEFLKIFDGPSVTECYVRRPTVVPQQSLAMANNELTLALSKALAKRLSTEARDDQSFARLAFEHVLARHPKPSEMELCQEFLQTRAQQSSDERAREALVGVLFNHNEFVTVR